MTRPAAAGRRSITRRLAARILARGHGAALGAELEHILYHRPCGQCGAWRCPYCRWVVLDAWDHQPWCRYAPAARKPAK